MRPLVILLLFALPAAAAPVPKGVKKKPVGSPDGVWVLVKFSSDGKEPAPPQGMALDWVVEGEYIHVNTKFEPAHHAKGAPNFTVRDPARPNLRMWGDRVAAFEVDGDTLRACYAHDGRKELTECRPQPGVHYYVFERAKAEK